MPRRTKCTFCGAPVDLSSTRCKFCNQDYDFQKNPNLKFGNLFNKKKFSIVKPKFKELKTSVKNNFKKVSLLIKNKSTNTKVLVKNNVLITKDFLQKEFQKQRTKKIIFIYFPSFIFIIFVAINVNKVLKTRQIAYQEKIERDKKIEIEILKNLYLENGYEKRKKNDFKGALVEYDKAIKLKTNDPLPFIQKGKIHFLQKDYDLAVLNFTRGISKNREGSVIASETYLQRGISNFYLNNYNSAIKDLTEALILSKVYGKPKSKNEFQNEILFYRSISNMEENNYQEGLDDINIAIENEFRLNRSYRIRAEIRYYLKDYEGAIEDASKSIIINKNKNARDFYIRGYSNFFIGNKNLYCKDLQKTFKIGGERFTKYPKVTKLFEENCKIKIDYQDSIFKSIDKSKEQYYLEEIKKLIKYSGVNSKNCEKILKFSNLLIEVSNGADGYYYRAFSKSSCQYDYESSINDISKAIAINPYNSKYIFRRGIIHSIYDNELAAIEDFDKVISEDDNNENYYYFRGISKYNLKKYSEAIKDFELSKLINKKRIDSSKYKSYSIYKDYDENVYLYLAKSDLKLEKYVSALGHINYAIQKLGAGPRLKELYLYRGIIELKLKNTESGCKSIGYFKDDIKNYAKIERKEALKKMKYENFDEKSSIYNAYKKYCL